ncbi:MAG: FHA domain-containing protein [Myxococcales bacterium]|nr:FHA domain-containing protein [Myxococcales bacterium]
MGARLVIRSIDGRRVEEEIAYPFDQDRVVIGRGRSADVRMPHRTVSELHATLERDGSLYRVVDQGSTNGTLVGTEQLVPHRGRTLSDGDEVHMGVYTLSFHTGVLVTAPLSAEHTAELARRLVRQSMQPGQEGGRPPRLVVIAGNPPGVHVEIPVPPVRLLIGRGEHCQLVLEDKDVSREHAEITRDLEGVKVRDLASKNGLIVNAVQRKEARLQDGDELTLGECTVLFEEPAQLPLEALDGADDQHMSQRPPRLQPADAPTGPIQELHAEPTTRPRGRDPGLGTDLVVYGLAGIVLALSIAGLIMLMGGD